MFLLSCPMKYRILLIFLNALAMVPAIQAEIPHPVDAPKPLTPQESAKAFVVPAGMRIQLLASEPLIAEPSGLCWDESGRLFVCELHGYNVDGQYDIDELNKTGELDLVVRRIDASEEAKKKARLETYGTVKLLLDTDGDGVMDKAEVWADRLPPCYGIAAGNGGIIVACAPDIVVLKDTDGDNRVDVKETLFTGFGTGNLERGINAPTWGIDHWLYLGRGWNGGTITGPHLQTPVTLPATDFRIRADGTAIEPVSGSTKTFGMTFTAGGDRFVTTTTHPGHFVTPIPWRYLTRNPDAAAPVLDAPASDDTRVYPIAPIHPWRLKREQHAEYFAFYRKISLSDAAASGYFTSGCGPLVYQDNRLPGLQGHYLVCEPAQNLIHRAEIVREGTRLRLQRVKGEERSEFLASRDAWFHPMSLAPTPQGGVAIVDFYREIIEDYSAIPRHLQQQYGVINGRDRGRLWLLLPEHETTTAAVNLATLDDAALVAILHDEIHWRRRTAQRLLEERGKLPADYFLRGWQGSDADAKVIALRAADADHFQSAPEIGEDILKMDFDPNMAPQLALQIALSLGQSDSPKAVEALVRLAKSHGDLRWMDAAIASSAAGREEEILNALPGAPEKGEPVMINLAGVIASRGNADEITRSIAALETAKVIGKSHAILKLGLEETKPLASTIELPVPTIPTVDQNAAAEKRVSEVLAAFKKEPNLDEGRILFQGICGACHRSHGIGFAVGPDLDAEFQRAPEIILRDILFPSEAARPGYETILAKTSRGETLLGISSSDSPTSLTLRIPGGTERTLLRKRTEVRTIRNVSLMPSGLGDAMKPEQIANIIAFLRTPLGQ